MTDMRLAIAGAGGRMGRVLTKLVLETQGVALAGALEREGSALIGEDAGALAGHPRLGVEVTASVARALANADGVLDFTLPHVSVGVAQACAERGVVHVCGATGFSPAEDGAIAEAAGRTAIVKSGNFSLGVNVLQALVRKAAAALDADFDIEIVETHHNQKIDAPSGTALMLGQSAAAGRGVTLADVAERGRDGVTGARKRGAIGFAALRGGAVVGEHTVMLIGPAERIELTHVAQDRALFARGALKAALWARGRAPGLYSMADVLGLPDL